MPSDPRRRRAARHALPGGTPAAPSRDPLTVERITDAALQVVQTVGYDALTVRRIAAVLGTGPSSLYAHIVDRDDLDDLLVGRLCAEVVVPAPDPARWRDQLREVFGQIRDQYLAYPGISRATLGTVPTNLATLTMREGLLAITLAGGVEPRDAAWALDAASLYVAAYAWEQSVVQRRRQHADAEWVLSREELVDRFGALPAETFPHTRRHAAALISGTGHDRFEFTLGLILDNLRPAPRRGRRGQNRVPP